MSAKDKAENLKNMRLRARAHVKPMFPSPNLHFHDPKLCLLAASLSQTEYSYAGGSGWTGQQTISGGARQTGNCYKCIYEDYSLLGYEAVSTSHHRCVYNLLW